MPTVSVIIPTYNRALLLKEAIQSVLDQTYSDFEIIVVDDGSTDNTPQVVKELRRHNNKVKYIYQENKGRSAARNLGLRIARGDYITFLDSDDIFLPEKLNMQVSIMEKNQDLGMIYSLVRRMDNDGRIYESSDWLQRKMSGWIYPHLLFIKNNFITVPSVMVRDRIIHEVGGFNETMHICEDLDLWRRIARGYRILRINQPLAIVRTHGLDSTLLEQKIAARSYYYHMAIADDPSLARAIKKKLFSEMYSHYGIEALNNGRFQFGFHLLMKSVRTNFLQFMKSCGLYSVSLVHSCGVFLLKHFLSPVKYQYIRNFYRRMRGL